MLSLTDKVYSQLAPDKFTHTHTHTLEASYLSPASDKQRPRALLTNSPLASELNLGSTRA